MIRQCPLQSSPCSATQTLLNRDLLELHMTSLKWYPTSGTEAAKHLIQWLEILQMPWVTGKSTRTVQNRMTSLMKSFGRLQKNVNARVDRGGNESASRSLSEFLNAPFDKMNMSSGGFEKILN